MGKYILEIFYGILYKFRDSRDYMTYFILDLKRCFKLDKSLRKVNLIISKSGYIKL